MIPMQVVSAEQKKKVLEVLEVAIQVGTPLQIGRLWGIGEQMARGHEEEYRIKRKREHDAELPRKPPRQTAGTV